MAKPLTKHQKRALKKKTGNQKLSEKRKALKRDRDIKKFSRYAGILLIVVVAVSFVYSTRPDPQTSPVLKISPESLSLGDVSIAKGTVAVRMKIENTGKVDLILNDMETSCACTTAALIYEDVEGPPFGMRSHGTNPEGWQVAIKPGDTAFLKIYYDPTVHRDLIGSVTRNIAIYSNDPKNSVKNVYITANQIA